MNRQFEYFLNVYIGTNRFDDAVYTFVISEEDVERGHAISIEATRDTYSVRFKQGASRYTKEQQKKITDYYDHERCLNIAQAMTATYLNQKDHTLPYDEGWGQKVYNERDFLHL